jgi:hypothetical protein
VSRKGSISIGWDDPDEADAVADVLEDAALRGAEIIDHGYWDDAQEIRRQADEVRRDAQKRPLR